MARCYSNAFRGNIDKSDVKAHQGMFLTAIDNFGNYGWTSLPHGRHSSEKRIWNIDIGSNMGSTSAEEHIRNMRCNFPVHMVSTPRGGNAFHDYWLSSQQGSRDEV